MSTGSHHERGSGGEQRNITYVRWHEVRQSVEREVPAKSGLPALGRWQGQSKRDSVPQPRPAVPERCFAVLLCIGGVGLIVFKRRRKRTVIGRSASQPLKARSYKGGTIAFSSGRANGCLLWRKHNQGDVESNPRRPRNPTSAGPVPQTPITTGFMRGRCRSTRSEVWHKINT